MKKFIAMLLNNQKGNIDDMVRTIYKIIVLEGKKYKKLKINLNKCMTWQNRLDTIYENIIH